MSVFKLIGNTENISGYLAKYVNILIGYRRRFFVLVKNELMLYEYADIDADRASRGYPLQNIAIESSDTDFRLFELIYRSGTRIYLRADNWSERERWVGFISESISVHVGKIKIAEEMQVNVAGLRRNLKNIAHNYSEAQIKVREATSNDPWGPSSTLMTEIAEMTYNVVSFTEIMQMIWKRLNDHGRNWRHVYKALTLLEYIIKAGSERVAQQCKENIFAIQTLMDFQHIEEGKDHGINVREKAKQLVTLLKDAEKLKNERVKALKVKERFAQTSGNCTLDDGSDVRDSAVRNNEVEWGEMAGSSSGGSRSVGKTVAASEIENARPQTIGEEELQLQLALAMSREEADQEEIKRKSDDIRLQMALSESENELQKKAAPSADLLDISLDFNEVKTTDPWSIQPSTSRNTTQETKTYNEPWLTKPSIAVPLAMMNTPHSINHLGGGGGSGTIATSSSNSSRSNTTNIANLSTMQFNKPLMAAPALAPVPTLGTTNVLDYQQPKEQTDPWQLLKSSNSTTSAAADDFLGLMTTPTAQMATTTNSTNRSVPVVPTLSLLQQQQQQQQKSTANSSNPWAIQDTSTTSLFSNNGHASNLFNSTSTTNHSNGQFGRLAGANNAPVSSIDAEFDFLSSGGGSRNQLPAPSASKRNPFDLF